jgi:hypothetical protein
MQIFFQKNLKGIDNLGYLGIGGRIISKCIWLRKGTSNQLL